MRRRLGPVNWPVAIPGTDRPSPGAYDHGRQQQIRRNRRRQRPDCRAQRRRASADRRADGGSVRSAGGQARPTRASSAAWTTRERSSSARSAAASPRTGMASWTRCGARPLSTTRHAARRAAAAPTLLAGASTAQTVADRGSHHARCSRRPSARHGRVLAGCRCHRIRSQRRRLQWRLALFSRRARRTRRCADTVTAAQAHWLAARRRRRRLPRRRRRSGCGPSREQQVEGGSRPRRRRRRCRRRA